MRTRKIYLAGPITGLTYAEATGWRTLVQQILRPTGIECFSPLLGADVINDDMATDRAIMSRDYHDVVTSDLIIANFLGAIEKSTGTIMELGFAYAHRIPVIGVMEREGNAHDHPMVREALAYRVTSIEMAASIARRVLLSDAS